MSEISCSTGLLVRLFSPSRPWKRTGRSPSIPTRMCVIYKVPDFLRNHPKVKIQGEFSWVFILNEVDAGTTRLILRTRVNYGPCLFRVLMRPCFWLVDFVLARKMLRGIKWRVEQSRGQWAERARGFVRKYSGEDEPLAMGTEGE